MDAKLKRLKSLRNFWDIALSGTFVALLLAFVYIAAFYVAPDRSIENMVVYGIAGLLAAYPVLFIFNGLDKLIRRHLIKSYYIEDHEYVIKLIGSVGATEMTHAHKDLLSIRPGYKIANNSFKDYGCTIAAIPATDDDLEAKRQLIAMGVQVTTIG